MTGRILLAATGWDARPWEDELRRNAPGRAVTVYPDEFDPAAIDYALVWNPPAGLLAGLTNLKAIFALGAGVDQLLRQPDLPDLPIVRVVCDDLTQRMTEWVVLQALLHHRRQRAYDRQQAEHVWRGLDQPAAADIGVGVMGLGVLGTDSALALRRLGFRVAGWSRRPSTIEGVESFHGAEGLPAFLARTEILVSLLPLTPETKGILSMPLFEQLSRTHAPHLPVLINAGRGGLQVEADIVAAVRSGVLAGASLDVFAPEPLDPESPLWDLPNVTITPHVAAASDAAAIIPGIVRQIEAFEAGQPLVNVIDRASAY